MIRYMLMISYIRGQNSRHMNPFEIERGESFIIGDSDLRELLDRPYYEPAAMGKYLASIMDTLNHDVSVEKVRSATSKITKLLAKNREEKK